MLNNASKFALGVTGLAAVAFVGSRLADGDRVSAIVLVGLAVAAAIVAFGIARSVGSDAAPFVAPDAPTASTAIEPSDVGGASYGPLLAAVGTTVSVAGGAMGPTWVGVGALAAIVGLGVWVFDTYRAPGVLAARDAANVDNRLLGPIALPLVSTIAALSIAFLLSRVLLAVDETASWIIAFVVAAVMFAILSLVASKMPQRRVTMGLAGVGALALVVAGGTFAGIGQREFHPHGETIPEQTISAQNIAFDRKVMALPADTKAEIIFTNLDIGVFHNVAIYSTDTPGTPYFSGRPSAKGTEVYRVPELSPGTYRYICDFHPAMVGELRVTKSAAPESAHASEKESEH